MEVLNVAMAALVEKGQDGTFLIIEDADHPDQFLQHRCLTKQRDFERSVRGRRPSVG